MNYSNKKPHIQLDSSIRTTAAILPGDPARVDTIASFLSDVREEAFNREYKSITGTYKGLRILAISTGMGGPSAAICAEELADLGITHMIRIGSCGALQSSLRLGQLVICDRAVCDDGTSQTYTEYLRYAAPDIPAALASEDDLTSNMCCSSQTLHTLGAGSIQYAYASPNLTKACAEAAKSLGFPYIVAPTRSHDGLYFKRKPQLDEFYSQKGIYASDMETAALFAVGTLRGIHTASILNTVVEWKKDLKEGISSYKSGEKDAADGERNEIILALEALAGQPVLIQ